MAVAYVLNNIQCSYYHFISIGSKKKYIAIKLILNPKYHTINYERNLTIILTLSEQNKKCY